MAGYGLVSVVYQLHASLYVLVPSFKKIMAHDRKHKYIHMVIVFTLHLNIFLCVNNQSSGGMQGHDIFYSVRMNFILVATYKIKVDFGSIRLKCRFSDEGRKM
jgi:hypothetical protein